VTGYADPPAGFREALGAGDGAFRAGLLAGAAVWYSRAIDVIDAMPMSAEALKYGADASVRMEVFLGVCAIPGLGRVTARDPHERWAALLTVAESGKLVARFRAAFRQVIGMVRRPPGPYDRPSFDPEESEHAWEVLMACPRLSESALQAIDCHLIIEGLDRHRAELATHPSADCERWLGMLERSRTTDLVHTLWEMPRAMEDERVREAVGAPARPGPAETDDETD
jgi:hypothetical protein